MWNLKRGRDFIPDISLDRLRRIYLSEKDGKAKFRLLAAIHRKAGESLGRISRLLENPKVTVYDWLRRFQIRGIGAKDNIRQPGRPPRLTPAQARDLVKRIEAADKPLTITQVQELIRRRYGKTYSKQHAWRVLSSIARNARQKKNKKKTAQASDGSGRTALAWLRKE